MRKCVTHDSRFVKAHIHHTSHGTRYLQEPRPHGQNVWAANIDKNTVYIGVLTTPKLYSNLHPVSPTAFLYNSFNWRGSPQLSVFRQHKHSFNLYNTASALINKLLNSQSRAQNNRITSSYLDWHRQFSSHYGSSFCGSRPQFAVTTAPIAAHSATQVTEHCRGDAKPRC